MGVEKSYQPAPIEQKWYAHWEEAGFFKPSGSGKPFVIVIPPPNVTGILHMGHALNNTLQDILIRYHRMKGESAIWIPGTDHAGIATQNVVEKKLAKESKKRHDLGREKFVQEVWKWKEQYGSTIIRQLKRLGSSCDWSRTRFTMDDGLSRAVTEVFVRLHEQGLIYRGDYVINWCPRCQTALSDEEAEHREVAGHLYHIRYPAAEGQGYLVVATTRPETMLGDTAVAVHPKDERYRGWMGRKINLPLVGRQIPVIADDWVDRAFGTGAVKVTPAHDPNDFQISRRHAIEVINIMHPDARIHEPHYEGLDRFVARKRVVEDLQKLGLLEKIEDHRHAVGHCYRCHTIVEPLLSKQWFVKMKPLAEKATQAVQDQTITFTPSRWTKVYLHWMENIRDWCISRQIWWGHRIPVWYCKPCGDQGVFVARQAPTRCPKCSGTKLDQDPDVLDTWFSSWLWPFSTLGWPEKSEDLKRYYPTSVLVTAPEIIFFWVARMIMAGYFVMGKEPFQHVVIHGTVRDDTGKKMSKSLGNIIDPLEIIDKFGADALRFSLAMITAVGSDVFVSEEKFHIGRNFANKLWNASRLLGVQQPKLAGPAKPRPDAGAAGYYQHWIESRLHTTIRSVSASLEEFEFNQAAREIYRFVWNDFCDWYLELMKPHFETFGRKPAVEIMEQICRLLHPLMPFITEELWQDCLRHLGKTEDTIMRSPWPCADLQKIDAQIENSLETFMRALVATRRVRADLQLPPATRLPKVLVKASAGGAFEKCGQEFKRLAGADSLEVGPHVSRPPRSVVAVEGDQEIYVPLDQQVDLASWARKLQDREKELTKLLSGLDARLANPAFTDKAPPDVVASERQRLQEYAEERKRIIRNLEGL